MNLPANGVVLAPGSLHLPLYEKLLGERAHTLGLEVTPLETYMNLFAGQERTSPMGSLYAYREALKDLPPANAFAGSVSDLSFLNNLLNFAGEAKLYGITEFPADTAREKDLKDVLERILPVPILEDESQAIKEAPIPYDDIYIVRKELPTIQRYWADFLVKNGAHELGAPGEPVKTYWSASNMRKVVEAAARGIIAQGYPANEVQIALANPEDATTVKQIFDAYGIPWSEMHKEAQTPVVKMFSAALRFAMSRDEEARRDFLALASPEDMETIQTYRTLFPQGSRLSEMEYEENRLMDAGTFQRLQNLEVRYRTLLGRSLYMDSWHDSWNEGTYENIARAVQNALPDPTQDDLKAFDWVIQEIAAARPYIHAAEDLQLLIDYLDSYKGSQTPDRLKGVLIGGREDITFLRPTVFYLGPHAGAFPGLKTVSGLFSESYLARTNWPSLESRLEEQRRQIFDVLSLPERLYCIVPQSDYTGRALENSPDLARFMGGDPEFQKVPEASIHKSPDFSFSSDLSSQYFLNGECLRASSNQLSSFEVCPLRHYLRYGLAIHQPRQDDALFIPGDLMVRVLNKAYTIQNQTYQNLTREEIEKLVQEEFAFLGKVFPHKKNYLQALALEYAHRVETALEPLSLVATNMHMQVLNESLQNDFTFRSGERQVEMAGPLDPVPYSSAAFTVLDGTNVTGSMQISLNDTASQQKAFDVSYRTAQPAIKETDACDALEAFTADRVVSGFKEKNFKDREEGLARRIEQKKTIPTFEERENAWKDTFEKYVARISGEQAIAPVHKADACKSCPYRSICRSAAREEA